MVADTGFANIIKVDLNLLKKKLFYLSKKEKKLLCFTVYMVVDWFCKFPKMWLVYSLLRYANALNIYLC